MVFRNPLGGPTCTRKPSLHKAKFSFKKVGLGCFKKEGRWAGFFRPNRIKGLNKGLACDSLLGFPSSMSGESKAELPKPIFAREFSEQKASPLVQGRNASPLKIYSPGMFPISTVLGGGVSGESSCLSSPSFSRMGDSVGLSQSRQPKGTFEDPLETKLPLCMVLKDGRSFTLPNNEGANRQEGGVGAVTFRSRGIEVQTPHFHITGVGEGEKDKSPWVNKKFLGFYKWGFRLKVLKRIF